MAKGFPKEFETASAIYTRSGDPLGQGGVGTVFGVTDNDSENFALKLFTSPSVSRELTKRFENELRFFISNRHANLVGVVDNGFILHNGRKLPFYVMRRFSGTLRDLIKQGIPSEKILSYFLQILNGLEVLHQKKCWHRDLKPENILWDQQSDTLLIADLGAAHFAEEELHTLIETKATSRMANFRYSAPEQREPGRQVDHRSDIFSLGLLLNEMFTGDVIQGQGHRTIEQAEPDFAELDELVDAMIQQEPENRPQSIASIIGELASRGFKVKAFTTSTRVASLNPNIIEGQNSLNSILARRTSNSLSAGDPQATTLLQRYLEAVIEQLPGYAFEANKTQLDTEMVLAKINEITSLRDEVVDVIISVAKYLGNDESFDLLHEFFEKIIPLVGDFSSQSWARDHLKIFVSELFLYTTAASLKWRRYLQLNRLTDIDYYVRPDDFSLGDTAMIPFYFFAQYSDAIHLSNQQPGQSRLYSPQGQLIKSRSLRTDLDFEDLKQADFVLYLLYNLDRKANSNRIKSRFHWYPRLSPYFQERRSSFEVFARSESHSFFDRFRMCLRNTQKDDLIKLIDWLKDERQDVFYEGAIRLDLKLFTNIERLDSVA